MLKEKLQIWKGNLKEKTEGSNKRKIENLVVFLLILIVTLIIINAIWNPKEEKKVQNTTDKVLATENSNKESQENTVQSDNLEIKLAQILEKIKGVGKVSVLITYSQTSKTVPIYNEDYSSSNTEESDSGGGSRTVSENSNKKEVVFQENNGEKEVLTQSIVKPVAEGAIITAEGAVDASVKINIIQAVEAVTGLATHKIQVFEMKENE